MDQHVIIPLKLEGKNHNKGQTYLLNYVIRIWGYYTLQVLSILIWGHLPSAGTFHFIMWAMTLNEIYNVLPLRIWGHFMQQCRLPYFRDVSSFRNLGGQVQRVPTSRAFWDLEKNVINLKRLLCTLLIVYYLLLGYFIRKYVVKTQDS